MYSAAAASVHHLDQLWSMPQHAVTVSMCWALTHLLGSRDRSKRMSVRSSLPFRESSSEAAVRPTAAAAA